MLMIVNNFHGTEYRLRVRPGDVISPSQIRRARKALCGTEGCMCGGLLGGRGPNPNIENLGYDATRGRRIRIAMAAQDRRVP
jgi:hypothetical protein